MNKTIFTGSAVALVTPFKGSTTDYDNFAKLIEYHIAHKTDALVICGTTGEASTMPDDEHIEAIRFAVEVTAKRLPVIAGIGSNDTAHGINLSKRAAQAGADAFLNVTPYYNKANVSGLTEHYRKMCSCCDVPTILYNVPGRTGVNIPLSVYENLKDVDTIVAVKEASGNFSYTMQVAAEFGDRYDLYSGNDDIVVPMLAIGGKGVISVLANVMPDETHDMCELFFEGKTEESAKIQLELLDLINALFIEVNPAPVKTALDLMGFEVGNLRLPLGELSPANKEELIRVMKKHGLLK